MKTEQKYHSIFILSLAIYLLMMPFDFMSIIPNVSLSKILIAVPLLGAVLDINSFGKLKVKSLYTLLYPLAIFVSMLFSIDFNGSLDRLVSVALNVGLIIFLASRRYMAKELEVVYAAVGLSGWLLVIMCIIFSEVSSDGRLTVMINGESQDPNYLCGFLILPTCYYLFRFLQDRKLFGIISVVAFAVVVFLTGSRGGTLAVLTAVVVLLFKMASGSRKKMWNSIGFLVLVAIFVIIIWDYLPEEITIRFSSEFNEEDQGSHRIEIWESLLKHFANRPFSGQLFGTGASTVVLYSAYNYVAHNVFIEALAEMGALGLILIGGMYMYYGVQAWREKRTFVFPAFVGYMIMCLTMSLYNYKPIWNLLLIIVISFNVTSEEHEYDYCM